MNNIKLVVGGVVLSFAALLSQPVLAFTADDTVICKDGANSKGGKGACKGHGGIDKKATKAADKGGSAATAAAPSAPASAPVSAAPAASTADAGEMVACKDGAMSKKGRGACKGHGGMDKGKKDKQAEAPASTSNAAPPSAAPAPAPTAAPAPAPTESGSTNAKSVDSDAQGATAKCKDGTYSHSKHHSGSCSHHGGVAQFLN